MCGCSGGGNSGTGVGSSSGNSVAARTANANAVTPNKTRVRYVGNAVAITGCVTHYPYLNLSTGIELEAWTADVVCADVFELV